jgi:hypothetical protein
MKAARSQFTCRLEILALSFHRRGNAWAQRGKPARVNALIGEFLK